MYVDSNRLQYIWIKHDSMKCQNVTWKKSILIRSMLYESERFGEFWGGGVKREDESYGSLNELNIHIAYLFIDGWLFIRWRLPCSRLRLLGAGRSINLNVSKGLYWTFASSMACRSSGALAVITATGRGSTGCDDASCRSNVVAIMMERLETERIEGVEWGLVPSAFSRLLTPLSSLLAPIRERGRGCLTILETRRHWPPFLSIYISLSLSLSLVLCWCWCIALTSRHRSHVTHGSYTRSCASVYDVTWTDRRYLAVWTFSKYTLHWLYICEGTRNCPVVLVTCWHPSQNTSDAAENRTCEPTVSINFQKEISISPDWYFN